MSNASLKAFLCSFALGACTLTAASANNDKTIAHVLSRVAFGPATVDQERIRAIGVTRYIDEQLHPERLADSGMEPRLAALQTLRMTSREIAEQFEIPQLQARAAKKRAALANPGNQDDKAGPDANQPSPEEQRRANLVVLELSEQKMLRAAYSERQLQEVLVDFWFNHFNVDARKGPAKFLLTEYEREAIRPHVLGRFRDLLEATAKSPAMLFYLDNWMSADPNGPHGDASSAAPRYRPLRQGRFGNRSLTMPAQFERVRPNGKNTPKGLNENYGRELMELHTLGVDGGYTQQDVTEVARAFTGWTIERPRLGGGYHFDARLHDAGQKIVLGHVIKAGGGENDGEQVLDILARHPATARFIATALIRRFVSDTPPPTLVDKVAARFRQTDGDLREVMRTILTSPEFLAPDAYGTKVKTPLEFVVSAIRATNAQVDNAQPLVRVMRDLGMPLYLCQPPTGYKDTADAWVNTGALVSRMNFALDLASGKLPGIAVPSLEARAMSLVDDLGLGDSTRSTIAQATSEPQRVALTLGSPEFQRR